jgi:hypothetical protein
MSSQGKYMASLLLGAIMRAMLPIINRIHTMALGIKPLERNSIICVEVRRHNGCAIKLEGGCEVRPGDPVIKLHLNNAWIAQRLRSNSESDMKSFPRGLIWWHRCSVWLDCLSCSRWPVRILCHRLAEYPEDKAGRSPHRLPNAGPAYPLAQKAYALS